jgi:hypothetical protein
MRLEKQNIPSTTRVKVNLRLRGYEADVDAAKRKLSSLSGDRAALFGSRYTDDPAGGPSLTSSDAVNAQRQQLLSGSERLDRSTQRLIASQAIASETEHVGNNVLRDLRGQRDMIESAHHRLLESEGYVDRSVKTLRGMARR